jgi:hypothetical protein
MVDEFVWFEEWAGWSGVEAHGGTDHGTLFHREVDTFIEEEWTFYEPPKGAAPVWLPPPSQFFNDMSKRSNFYLAHVKTDGEAQRSQLLSNKSRFQMTSVILGEEDESSSNYAVLLENRFRPGEFALISEGERGSTACIDQHIGVWLQQVLATGLAVEAGDVMAFSPPLWPEDMSVTEKAIEGGDEESWGARSS